MGISGTALWRLILDQKYTYSVSMTLQVESSDSGRAAFTLNPTSSDPRIIPRLTPAAHSLLVGGLVERVLGSGPRISRLRVLRLAVWTRRMRTRLRTYDLGVCNVLASCMPETFLREHSSLQPTWTPRTALFSERKEVCMQPRNPFFIRLEKC